MRHLVCLASVIVMGLPAMSQTPWRDQHLKLPPEFCGEPQKPVQLPPSLKKFLEALPESKKGEPKTPLEAEPIVKMASTLIDEAPDLSFGYYLRAYFRLISSKGKDTTLIINDIDSTIRTRSADSILGNTAQLSDLYSLRAKAMFIAGKYPEAIDDLEKAVLQAEIEGTRVLYANGDHPRDPSDDKIRWDMSEFNIFIQNFKNDYRSYLFRGIYYSNYYNRSDAFIDSALKDLVKSTVLSPTNATPHLFIGKAYLNRGYSVLGSKLSENQRMEKYRKFKQLAINSFSKAISLRPEFSSAYVERAECYDSLKQYNLSIKDYTRAIELNKENNKNHLKLADAYISIDNYYMAIDSLDEYIKRERDNKWTISSAYKKRGDCQLNQARAKLAIMDYTKAIEYDLMNSASMMNLAQIRRLYPEFDTESDESLYKFLHRQFSINWDYQGYVQKMKENKDDDFYGPSNYLYEARGDAYLQANQYENGVNDFNRIFNAKPTWGNLLNRWRPIGTNGGKTSYFLDIKTVEFQSGRIGKIWIKRKHLKGYDLEFYEIDCNKQRIREISSVGYNLKNEVVRNSEVIRPWQTVVPGSIGEDWFNGMCSGN